MEGHKSISDIKLQAKERLLGNYGVAVRSFVLLFVTSYALSAILRTAYEDGFLPAQIKDVAAGAKVAVSSNVIIMDMIMSNILTIITNVFTTLLGVGFLYTIICISQGKQSGQGDVFYCFKNHPDKVIIIALITSVIRLIVNLPTSILMNFYVSFEPNMDMTIIWKFIAAFIVGVVLEVFVVIEFSMSYFIYLDDTQKSALACMAESHKLINGNRLRYLGLMLSFVGHAVLGVLSCGIGFLYIYPYQKMAELGFYNELIGKSDAEEVDYNSDSDFDMNSIFRS